MPNTTILLTSEVYKLVLDVKHEAEKLAGHPQSFSDAVKFLCMEHKKKKKE